MSKGAYTAALIALVFSFFLSYAYAAGGGGGGSSGSGLGFGSRDSVFILINGEYSEKFSLKNNTKYELKVNVEDSNATINFGDYYLKLSLGDNYLDLNENNLADINFRLESVNGQRANLRIIDAKDLVQIKKEDSKEKIETPEAEEKAEAEIDDKKEDKAAKDNGLLRCANLQSLKERVKCRLEQEENEQEDELELYYLPEECAVLSGATRGICIARYKSVQTCWKFPVGEERVSCAKKAIRLETIQEEKGKCDKLTEENRSICAREIKNKNYNLIKWRFYDLEERAEDFMKRGLASEDAAVDFISKTEQSKIKFNDAKTKEERKNIILSVRNDWKVLAYTIKESLRGKNG